MEYFDIDGTRVDMDELIRDFRARAYKPTGTMYDADDKMSADLCAEYARDITAEFGR